MIWATVSLQSCFCWLYRVSPSSAAKNIINLISVLTICWCPCEELIVVLLEKDVYYDQCVPEVTLSAFALLHSVLQGQSCLLLQVSLDFLLLHSIHDEVVRGADRRMDCFILKNEEKYNKRKPLVSSSGSHSETVGKRNISNFKLEGEQLLIPSQWRQSELCNKGREICLPHPYTRRGTCHPVWRDLPFRPPGCEWNLLCVE